MIYFDEYDEEGRNVLGISFEELMISLTFAIAHATLEIIFLKIESNSCEMSLSSYSIVCLNNRFNWVPFQDKLKNYERTEDVIDYTNIGTELMCTKRKVPFEYEFSNESLSHLT